MSETFDRRDFARKAILSSITAGTLTGSASAEQTPPEKKPVPAPKPELPEKLLLEIVKQRYPSEHLTPEVLSEIEQDILFQQIRARRLKSVPLSNGDAPLVFRAYRGK